MALATHFTRYALNKLGTLLAGKYGHVTYYRVDTPLWRVDGPEDVLEQARDTSYYKMSESFKSKDYTKIGEGSGYDSLCLTAALEEGRSQDLSILISNIKQALIKSICADLCQKFLLAGRDF